MKTETVKTHSRYNTTRKILIFWSLFVGIGAVAGSIGMLVAPDGSALGMQEMIPLFQVLPFADVLFQNYIFPGIALLCVNGLTNIIAAVLMLAKKRVGTTLSGIFGVTLMLWICIQFVIFPANAWSICYFIFGALQAITGYAAYVFAKQEDFSKEFNSSLETSNTNEKSDAKTDAKTLVVYFSRMGYTKKVATCTAREENADVYEIKATEQTAGTAGFWWCGRFAMHKWEMPIEEPNVDFSKYDKVIICSPIWAFNIAGPIRTFCKAEKGKIKDVSYILVHHQKSNYEGAIKEMDELLEMKHESARSICCQKGEYLASNQIA